jgi:hypothetical protein
LTPPCKASSWAAGFGFFASNPIAAAAGGGAGGAGAGAGGAGAGAGAGGDNRDILTERVASSAASSAASSLLRFLSPLRFANAKIMIRNDVYTYRTTTTKLTH